MDNVAGNTAINEIKQLARNYDADTIMISTDGQVIVYRLPQNSLEMRLFLKEITEAQWKEDANYTTSIARKFEVFLQYQGFEMEECSLTFYIKARAVS